jgi:hypothetical protein
LGAGVTVIIVDVPVPTVPAAGCDPGDPGATGVSGFPGGGNVVPGGWLGGGTLIKLGVVPMVEAGGTGAGVGMVPTIGVVPTVGVGVDVGVNVSLDTTTVGAVGLASFEPSHAVTKSANRTKVPIRVIPHARATAIPRVDRRFAYSRAAAA